MMRYGIHAGYVCETPLSLIFTGANYLWGEVVGTLEIAYPYRRDFTQPRFEL